MSGLASMALLEELIATARSSAARPTLRPGTLRAGPVRSRPAWPCSAIAFRAQGGPRAHPGAVRRARAARHAAEDPGLHEPHSRQPRGERRDVALAREVLRQRRAHCLEGAIVAACALWVHGRPPLVVHHDCDASDYPHCIAVFRRGRCWGRDLEDERGVLRYRDPVTGRCGNWRSPISTSTATGRGGTRFAAIPAPSTCAAWTPTSG